MALGTREISRYCAPPNKKTGCNQCELIAQEQCNQTFYLKQQSIESNNTLQQENKDLKKEIEQVKTELDYLQSQQEITTSTSSQKNIDGNVIVFALILITVILLTVIITKHFVKK